MFDRHWNNADWQTMQEMGRGKSKDAFSVVLFETSPRIVNNGDNKVKHLWCWGLARGGGGWGLFRRDWDSPNTMLWVPFLWLQSPIFLWDCGDHLFGLVVGGERWQKLHLPHAIQRDQPPWVILVLSAGCTCHYQPRWQHFNRNIQSRQSHERIGESKQSMVTFVTMLNLCL